MSNRRPSVGRSAMVALVSLAACTDDDAITESGFAGDYEVSSFTEETGGCTGAGTPVAPPAGTEFFHLEDVTTDAGLLVGYFHCAHLREDCNDIYDLYKSFGQGPDGDWLTVFYASVQPPCTLTYRRHELVGLDDTHIQITEARRELADGALSGDACSKEVAKARKDELPCIEELVWIADRK